MKTQQRAAALTLAPAPTSTPKKRRAPTKADIIAQRDEIQEKYDNLVAATTSSGKRAQVFMRRTLAPGIPLAAWALTHTSLQTAHYITFTDALGAGAIVLTGALILAACAVLWVSLPHVAHGVQEATGVSQEEARLLATTLDIGAVLLKIASHTVGGPVAMCAMWALIAFSAWANYNSFNSHTNTHSAHS